MVGTHDLSEDGGGTRNVLSVDAEGVIARLFWPVLRLAMSKALAQENHGFKQHCEAARTVEQSR
jgi:hypothetical protein